MPIPTPTTDEDKINAIRLYRSTRIGPRNFVKLMDISESFDDAFERVVARSLAEPDLGISLSPQDLAEHEYATGQALGAHFLACGSSNYPELMIQDPNRPPFLWALGQLELLSTPRLAIIGSRNPSMEGVRTAAGLAKLLAYEGVTIVSGLARGIDAVAHEAALSLGTIGVVAGGADVKYPKSNRELQTLMSEHGLVISEMPFSYQPTARDFPKRNRIIASISRGVVVVEATLRSGTKLTVNDATALGRDIFAVPGHPFTGLAALPNQLIKEGAVLVRDVDDILDVIPEFRTKPPLPVEPAPPEAAASTAINPEPADNPENASLGRALIEGRAHQTLDGRTTSLPE